MRPQSILPRSPAPAPLYGHRWPSYGNNLTEDSNSQSSGRPYDGQFTGAHNLSMQHSYAASSYMDGTPIKQESDESFDQAEGYAHNSHSGSASLQDVTAPDVRDRRPYLGPDNIWYTYDGIAMPPPGYQHALLPAGQQFMNTPPAAYTHSQYGGPPPTMHNRQQMQLFQQPYQQAIPSQPAHQAGKTPSRRPTGQINPKVRRKNKRVIESDAEAEVDIPKRNKRVVGPVEDPEDDVPLMQRLSASASPKTSNIPAPRLLIKLKSSSSAQAHPVASTDVEDSTQEGSASPEVADDSVSVRPTSSKITKKTVEVRPTPPPKVADPQLGGSRDGASPDNAIDISDDTVPEPISWKLPDYEIVELETDKDFPAAKVSVPGMIREEMLLAADHPALSLTLIRTVFFPSHERAYPLPTRDPEPMHSLLNFNTVANIVIGVFTNQASEDSIPRIQPQEADPDEVFFAAVDNWRAGRELNREGYKTVRGIQEFCDVALDVIFYIKANGLGEESTGRKRRERSDKGVKREPRGPKAAGNTEGEYAGPVVVKEKKPRGQPKANTLIAKPTTKKTEEAAVKAKAKAKEDLKKVKGSKISKTK